LRLQKFGILLVLVVRSFSCSCFLTLTFIRIVDFEVLVFEVSAHFVLGL